MSKLVSAGSRLSNANIIGSSAKPDRTLLCRALRRNCAMARPSMPPSTRQAEGEWSDQDDADDAFERDRDEADRADRGGDGQQDICAPGAEIGLAIGKMNAVMAPMMNGEKTNRPKP